MKQLIKITKFKYLATIIVAMILPISFVMGQGVKFETSESWESLKKLAQAQKKYIFIDAYATWCSPCKEMDEKVYTSRKLGEVFNEKFISAKIQIDKTVSDNDTIRRWYQYAETMKKDFNVTYLPTYLFFTSDGLLMDKASGIKSTEELLEIATNATNLQRHYFRQIEKYDLRNINYEELPSLANRAMSIQPTKAKVIAKDYIDNYLLKQPESIIYTKDNLEFIGKYIGDKGDRSFDFYKENISRINRILGRDKAEYVLRNAISFFNIPIEETWMETKPNWGSIENKLLEKYGDIGLETVYGKRMIFSFLNKDWESYGKYYLLYFKRAYRRPEYNINDISFVLFQNVDDINVLKFACDTVMKYAMEEWYPNDPMAYDTYANLLYKTGRIESGIAWEEKAVKMKEGSQDEKLYTDALEKMKKNLPTWNIN